MAALQKVTVLTGAGISAESGISTFRDAGGLWEGHDVMEVASPQGWNKNMELVLDFYNQRRRQLKEVEPNDGHRSLVELEKHFYTTVVTQNVDDLHERAGSKNVIHLHGELLKSRSSLDSRRIYPCMDDILPGQLCELGTQIRPHIVWFGEEVPMMDRAMEAVIGADILLIVGTSMQVYPAAGLVNFARPEIPIYYLDPRPHISWELSKRKNLKVIEATAVNGLPNLITEIISRYR